MNTAATTTRRLCPTSPWENLQKLTYAYDLAGNVQTLADSANSGQVQTFGYDWLDRLTSAATNAAGVGQYSHTYAYNAIGNLTSYNGNSYTYGTKPHAVTGAFGNAYGYDAVGNQTSRTVGGTAYTQSFDYENRLTEVKQSATSLATFLYDADGNRVKGTVGTVTTVYIAGLYEWQNGATTKYYEGGAIRRAGYTSQNGVFYSLSDRLNSTSALVNQNGTVNSRNYYYPYGGNRGGSAFSTLTTKRFTGQYHESSLPGGEGLAYYNARWYDSRVGAFISADTLVPSPGNPQTFNRYSYALGNPLKYIDPTGRSVDCGLGDSSCRLGRGSNNSGSGSIGLPPPPRVQQGQTVLPGGKYGHGLFTWGDSPIDIYVPPTVWFFPSSPWHHPIYRPNKLEFVEAGAYSGEYSGGDDWPGVCPAKLQDPVVPGTWQTARQYTTEQMPAGSEILAGFFGSMNNGLESDPPQWGEPIQARGVDALQMFAYGSQGALNSFRYENRFVLQVNATDELRVIIMQRGFEAKQWFYVGYGIHKPQTPWHGGDLWPR